jgi:hypothetical protein
MSQRQPLLQLLKLLPLLAAVQCAMQGEGGGAAPGSWTFQVQHPSTWTGNVVGLINPRINATQEFRFYEYDSNITTAQGNMSTSLLLPTQLPSGTSAATNHSRPLAWFNGRPMDLYVHEHNVLWPCSDATGKPLPIMTPIYDITKSYAVKAVFTYDTKTSEVWFTCTLTID